MKPPSSPAPGAAAAAALSRLDAHEQAALLRTGQISALELIDAAILRIEQLDARLNAVSYRDFDTARRRAAALRGPTSGFEGVPYLLKDSLDYAGTPTRCGSRINRTLPAASVDYAYARCLDAAGLIPLGKSNVPEFSLLPTTESLLYGPCRNPWSLAHSVGGSSGGAAAAVAAGLVPLAHGGDGGGSIRIPASCCGVFGLKPGRAANLRARAHHAVEDLLVGDAMISRSVRDAARAFGLASPGARTIALQPPVRRLRIALVTANFRNEQPHPDVARIIDATARLCEGLGHHVEPVALPVDGRVVADTFRDIWGFLTRELVAQLARANEDAVLEDLLEPWTLGLARWGETFEAADWYRVLEQLVVCTRRMQEFFGGYDVLLSPVLKDPPVRLGELAPTVDFEQLFERMFDYVSYSPLQNLAGLPSMSVPLFLTPAGLPVGSMFTAAQGGEELLFQLASELETACPWADRWPPIA